LLYKGFDHFGKCAIPLNGYQWIKLNDLGYSLKRVLKSKPKKKIAETEAIFEQIEKINREADEDPKTLRISLDGKVGVKVGEFDRGGKTRVKTEAFLP